MTEPRKRKDRRTFTYCLTIVFAFLAFHTLIPIKFHHMERTRLKGPYILIGNHLSMLDPVILGYACRRVHVRFLGKAELVKNPILRFYFKHMRMIAISRNATDMKALRACLKVLKDGNVLGIFPEGTRYKEGVMENLEAGTAMIALQSNVPILPAYIDRKVRPFRRMNCTFGEPFTISDIREKGVNKEAAEEVMQRIRDVYRYLVQNSAEMPK